jgi:acyl carrier protein
MSNLKQIEDSVIDLVAGVIKTTVNLDSEAGALPEWDSLAQMKIIIQLEKAYVIEIEDENIAKLNSVANIISYLQEKLV